MPDTADLEALDTEIHTLQARLNTLIGQYNATVDQTNERTLAELDVTDLTTRVREAMARIPAILDALDEVLAVHNEAFSLASATFPDTGTDEEDPWSRLLVRCGARDLDHAIDVLADRLGEPPGYGIDAEVARAKLDEILQPYQ